MKGINEKNCSYLMSCCIVLYVSNWWQWLTSSRLICFAFKICLFFPLVYFLNMWWMPVPAVARFMFFCTAGGSDLWLFSNRKLLIWKDQFLCNEKCAYIPPHLYFLHQMEDSKQGITDICMMLNCMVQKCGGKKFRFAHWSGLGPCKNFPQTAKDIAQFRGGVRKTISFSLLVF